MTVTGEGTVQRDKPIRVTDPVHVHIVLKIKCKRIE